MADEKGGGEQNPEYPANFGELVVRRYEMMKQNAEEFPYVWASYIMIYGGLAMWTAYRWRKLRNTEDRVRALQKRLREKMEERGVSNGKEPPSSGKSPQ